MINIREDLGPGEERRSHTNKVGTEWEAATEHDFLRLCYLRLSFWTSIGRIAYHFVVVITKLQKCLHCQLNISINSIALTYRLPWRLTISMLIYFMAHVVCQFLYKRLLLASQLIKLYRWPEQYDKNGDVREAAKKRSWHFKFLSHLLRSRLHSKNGLQQLNGMHLSREQSISLL